jgi:hypothetical protein
MSTFDNVCLLWTGYTHTYEPIVRDEKPFTIVDVSTRASCVVMPSHTNSDRVFRRGNRVHSWPLLDELIVKQTLDRLVLPTDPRPSAVLAWNTVYGINQ